MAILSNAVEIADAGTFSVDLGAMVLIKTITLSSAAANISFVDGASSVVLDNTYASYKFVFSNMHPATNNVYWSVNFSIDGGTNYNVAKTSTNFSAAHSESDGSPSVGYEDAFDLANGTGVQWLVSGGGIGNLADESLSGTLDLFNPSSTTFVKHFISNCQWYHGGNNSYNTYCAGYGNTTSAINAVQFTMHSGNIETGTIKLYGMSK